MKAEATRCWKGVRSYEFVFRERRKLPRLLIPDFPLEEHIFTVWNIRRLVPSDIESVGVEARLLVQFTFCTCMFASGDSILTCDGFLVTVEEGSLEGGFGSASRAASSEFAESDSWARWLHIHLY